MAHHHALVFGTNCRPFSSTFRGWRRVRESNRLASCESPCLTDKCLTVQRTLRQKCQRTLVGPVGFEPTNTLLLRQLRMPVPPRAWLTKLKLDRGSVTQSGSTEES